MNMTPKDTDDRLDALLAKGRLGGPRRDRILEAAIKANKPARSWQRMLAWAMPLSTAAAALLVFVALRPSSEFRARGGAGPVLEVACRDGACTSGSLLMFRASGAGEGGFLAAWAVPEGGDERVWYFPTVNGTSPALQARAETQTLPQGIRLGAEQPPGKYRVHLVLSRRALDRAQALAAPRDAVIAQSEATLEVVK